jgi:hypothetical protein
MPQYPAILIEFGALIRLLLPMIYIQPPKCHRRPMLRGLVTPIELDTLRHLMLRDSVALGAVQLLRHPTMQDLMTILELHAPYHHPMHDLVALGAVQLLRHPTLQDLMTMLEHHAPWHLILQHLVALSVVQLPHHPTNHQREHRSCWARGTLLTEYIWSVMLAGAFIIYDWSFYFKNLDAC